MNKKPLLLSLIVVGVVATVIGAVALFKPPSSTQTNTLRLVSSAGFWGNIAAQIGGDHVRVTAILDDPAADPHLYESGARDASAITQADVVIANGLGYDDFIDKVLSTVPNSNRGYINVASVLGAKDGDNPHLWYDLPRVSDVAETIAAVLSQKDPQNAGDYNARLQTLLAALQPLQTRIATIRSQHNGAPVAYTERVPEYLLQRAGLTVRTPAAFASAIEEGVEPSPNDHAAMRELITKKHIRALIYNTQAESPLTRELRDLAVTYGVPVVAMTETAPDGKSFQDWQLSQLDALLVALDNN